jgi:Protein of unknown function (DUF3293)
MTSGADNDASAEKIDAWRRAQLTVDYRGSHVSFEQVAQARHEPLYLITGWNPGAEISSHETNERANEQLAQLLEEAGYRFWPAVGADPSSDWSEPGYMVEGADRESMRALGRSFGQVAIYEGDGSGVRIVWCERDLVIEKND